MGVQGKSVTLFLTSARSFPHHRLSSTKQECIVRLQGTLSTVPPFVSGFPHRGRPKPYALCLCVVAAYLDKSLFSSETWGDILRSPELKNCRVAEPLGRLLDQVLSASCA